MQIRNENGDLTEIEKIIREYYGQVYANKLSNVNEMTNSRNTQIIKTHSGVENINRPITNKDIESVIKNPSRKKSLGPDGFIGKFYKMLKN